MRKALSRQMDEIGASTLQQAMAAVHRRTGTSVPSHVPDWTITSFAVERGDKIGSGGFGQVFKGTWMEIDVAIKELGDGTSDQARVILLLSHCYSR